MKENIELGEYLMDDIGYNFRVNIENYFWDHLLSNIWGNLGHNLGFNLGVNIKTNIYDPIKESKL